MGEKELAEIKRSNVTTGIAGIMATAVVPKSSTRGPTRG